MIENTETKTNRTKARFCVGDSVVIYKKGIVESVEGNENRIKYTVRYPDESGKIGLGTGLGYAVVEEEVLEASE